MFKATVSVVFEKYVHVPEVKKTSDFNFEQGFLSMRRFRSHIDYAQVFCKCGHVFVEKLSRIPSTQVVQAHAMSADVDIDDIDRDDEDSVAEVTCSSCGDVIRPEEYDQENNKVTMGGHGSIGGKVGASHLFSVKLFDNRAEGKDIIRLSFMYTKYISTFMGDGQPLPYKLATVNKRASIAFNTRTGMGYFVDGRLIRNITHSVGADKSRTVEYMEQMLGRAWDVPDTRDLFTEFFRRCLESRGASYFDMEGLLAVSMHNSLYAFSRFFHICKYPVLQNLPFIGYTNKLFTKKVRKVLPTLEKSVDVYKLLIGHSSKKVINYARQNSANMSLSLLFGPLIEDPNIFINYMSQFDAQDRNGMVSDRYLYYIDAMKFIKSLHSSDAHFMTRFMSDLRNWVVKRVRHDITGDWLYRKTGRESFTLTNALSLAKDLYSSYCQIKEIDPDYVVEYNNDLMELHDQLPRVLRKLNTENTVIEYSDEEKKYEMDLGGITFKLATDTDQLYDVGDELNICVGSYGEEAVAKQCIIVLGYLGGELFICMDIWRNNLTQVKTYYNNLPSEEVALTVRSWAAQCGINADDSYDLRRILRNYLAV